MSNAKAQATLVAVGLVLIAIGVGAAWFFQDNIYRGFEGPAWVTGDDLGKLDDLAGVESRWVAFTATKIVPTKIDLMSVKGFDKNVKSKFCLVQVGDRWLVAAVHPKFQGDVIVGELTANTNPLWLDAQRRVVDETAKIHEGRVVPYQLHAYRDYGENWRYCLYCCIGAVGLGLLLIVGAVWISISERWYPSKEEAPPQPSAAPELSQAFTFPPMPRQGS